MGKFNLISLEEAKRMAMDQQCIVVDLRSQYEYLHGHIENALNLPDADMAIIDSFNKKNYLWILYCRRGGLSFKLANEMSLNGYHVFTVVGGYR